MELGICPIECMDPRWFEAMELISDELARLQEEMTKKTQRSHG